MPSNLAPWNRRKLVGQKAPLRLGGIWSIRVFMQLDEHARDLALFSLAIDSKLRGCDLVSLGCESYRMAQLSPRGPSYCSARQADQFSLS